MITVLWDSTYNALVKELNELRELNENIRAEIQKKQSACDVFFDFDGVDVYSVERVPTTPSSAEHTLICWYDKDGKHHNWYCWCNHARHDQLVADFRKAKEKKGKK